MSRFDIQKIEDYKKGDEYAEEEERDTVEMRIHGEAPFAAISSTV